MNLRTILIICSSLFLGGCVQAPIFKGEDYALVKSSYPVVSLNGEEVEDSYRLDIDAGENTMIIVYHSYQYNYFCRFRWTAEAGTTYEVTDQENRYPLTLYRWVRTNRFWSSRLDPVDPLQCLRK